MKLHLYLLSISLMLGCILCAIVGVDYGQDFSKSVLVAPGVPFEVLLTSDSRRKDISGFALKTLPNGDLDRVFGSSTLSQCIKSPTSCLLHLKLLLGKSVDEPDAVEYISTHNGIKLSATKGNRNTISFDLLKMGVFPVEEALAMSFSEIKQRAQGHLKSASASSDLVNDIVITVPPFFNQAQRWAIRDAAEVAGFRVIGLVDDGTAVAVNYLSSRLELDQKQYHIVYDMGAGSTKATLFSVANNETGSGLIISVEGIGYDAKLGGDHLTKSVRDLLTEKFLDKNKKIKSKDFINDPKAMAKLWQAAEKAKMILSANNEASASVESLYQEIDFRAVISREEFQEYNQDLMTRITKPILDIFEFPLIEDSNITLKDVNSVILTGGSTRVPFVQQHLKSLVGEDKIAKNVNADEAAAMGVTLRGVLLSNMYKAKNIFVVERSISTYEAAIGSKQISVFPRGSKLGESVTLDLDVAVGEDFTVDLYENGVLFKSHVYSNVKKSILNLNESDTTKVVGSFTLSPSRIFTLDKVQVKSDKKKGVLERFFGGSETEEQEDTEQAPLKDETAKNLTAEEKAPRIKTVTLSGKSVYAKQHPMSAFSKEGSIATLRNLDAKDAARKKLDALRNNLEAALYDLRLYLGDVEADETTSDLVDQANELVSEGLEWLDYDSENASASVMKEKLQDVQVLKLKLIAYSEFLNKPLNADVFNALHKEALQSMHDIQDVMLTMAEDASSLKTNFTVIGLDWEAENKKIKISDLPPLDDQDVQKVFMSLNNDIQDLIEKHLVQTEESTDDKSGDYSKDELFAIHQLMKDKISKLDEYRKLLKKAHNQRVSALKKVYRKNFMKKLREAQLAAAKEEEEGKSTDTDVEADDIKESTEYTETSSTYESQSSSSSTTTTTTTIEETSTSTGLRDEL